MSVGYGAVEIVPTRLAAPLLPWIVRAATATDPIARFAGVRLPTADTDSASPDILTPALVAVPYGTAGHFVSSDA